MDRIRFHPGHLLDARQRRALAGNAADCKSLSNHAMQSPYDPAKLSAQNLWRAVKIAVADMSEPRGAIHSLAASTDASHRLRAIEAIREQIAEGQAPEEYAQLCRKLIADADNNCRWQALILAGEWIQLAPELVWSLVLEFGASGDEDNAYRRRNRAAGTSSRLRLRHVFSAIEKPD